MTRMEEEGEILNLTERRGRPQCLPLEGLVARDVSGVELFDTNGHLFHGTAEEHRSRLHADCGVARFRRRQLDVANGQHRRHLRAHFYHHLAAVVSRLQLPKNADYYGDFGEIVTVGVTLPLPLIRLGRLIDQQVLLKARISASG